MNIQRKPRIWLHSHEQFACYDIPVWVCADYARVGVSISPSGAWDMYQYAHMRGVSLQISDLLFGIDVSQFYRRKLVRVV